MNFQNNPNGNPNDFFAQQQQFLLMQQQQQQQQQFLLQQQFANSQNSIANPGSFQLMTQQQQQQQQFLSSNIIDPRNRGPRSGNNSNNNSPSRTVKQQNRFATSSPSNPSLLASQPPAFAVNNRRLPTGNSNNSQAPPTLNPNSNTSNSNVSNGINNNNAQSNPLLYPDYNAPQILSPNNPFHIPYSRHLPHPHYNNNNSSNNNFNDNQAVPQTPFDLNYGASMLPRNLLISSPYITSAQGSSFPMGTPMTAASLNFGGNFAYNNNNKNAGGSKFLRVTGPAPPIIQAPPKMRKKNADDKKGSNASNNEHKRLSLNVDSKKVKSIISKTKSDVGEEENSEGDDIEEDDSDEYSEEDALIITQHASDDEVDEKELKTTNDNETKLDTLDIEDKVTLQRKRLSIASINNMNASTTENNAKNIFKQHAKKLSLSLDASSSVPIPSSKNVDENSANTEDGEKINTQTIIIPQTVTIEPAVDPKPNRLSMVGVTSSPKGGSISIANGNIVELEGQRADSSANLNNTSNIAVNSNESLLSDKIIVFKNVSNSVQAHEFLNCIKFGPVQFISLYVDEKSSTEENDDSMSTSRPVSLDISPDNSGATNSDGSLVARLKFVYSRTHANFVRHLKLYFAEFSKEIKSPSLEFEVVNFRDSPEQKEEMEFLDGKVIKSINTNSTKEDEEGIKETDSVTVNVSKDSRRKINDKEDEEFMDEDDDLVFIDLLFEIMENKATRAVKIAKYTRFPPLNDDPDNLEKLLELQFASTINSCPGAAVVDVITTNEDKKLMNIHFTSILGAVRLVRKLTKLNHLISEKFYKEHGTLDSTDDELKLGAYKYSDDRCCQIDDSEFEKAYEDMYSGVSSFAPLDDKNYSLNNSMMMTGISDSSVPQVIVGNNNRRQSIATFGTIENFHKSLLPGFQNPVGKNNSIIDDFDDMMDSAATGVVNAGGAGVTTNGELIPSMISGLNANDNRTVYLGHLASKTTVEEICNVVRGGILQSIKLFSEKHICFITFITSASATNFYASSNVNGLTIHNKKIKVGWGKNSGELPNQIALAVTAGASRNVYIGVKDNSSNNSNGYYQHTSNFTKVPDEATLRKDFSHWGEIEQINFLKDGFCAFVNFMNISSSIKCVDEFQNGGASTLFNGRYSIYKINFAKDRCGNTPKFTHGSTTSNTKKKSKVIEEEEDDDKEEEEEDEEEKDATAVEEEEHAQQEVITKEEGIHDSMKEDAKLKNDIKSSEQEAEDLEIDANTTFEQMIEQLNIKDDGEESELVAANDEDAKLATEKDDEDEGEGKTCKKSTDSSTPSRPRSTVNKKQEDKKNKHANRKCVVSEEKAMALASIGIASTASTTASASDSGSNTTRVSTPLRHNRTPSRTHTPKLQQQQFYPQPSSVTGSPYMMNVNAGNPLNMTAAAAHAAAAMQFQQQQQQQNMLRQMNAGNSMVPGMGFSANGGFVDDRMMLRGRGGGGMLHSGSGAFLPGGAGMVMGGANNIVGGPPGGAFGSSGSQVMAQYLARAQFDTLVFNPTDDGDKKKKTKKKKPAKKESS